MRRALRGTARAADAAAAPLKAWLISWADDPRLDRRALAQAEAGGAARGGLRGPAAAPAAQRAHAGERDLANPLRLTGGLAHDAVWVVDSSGEFARSLPYRTALPRPVVGDAGLVALGWQAQFERFSAPEVSRRFRRAAKRPMVDHDWAAWMAGKALVQAALARPQGPASAWAAAIGSVPLDGSKGVNKSFRPWDGQLRQPLLLTDGQGVIGSAPIDGLLHPRHVLNTLGADAPERLCKARSSP